MCELYNERGIERIGVLDVGTGAWNFLLTAVGGTLIGKLNPKALLILLCKMLFKWSIHTLSTKILSFTGVIWGFMTGVVTRFTENVRVIEPIFIFVMAYLAYLNAEMLHLSGILS